MFESRVRKIVVAGARSCTCGPAIVVISDTEAFADRTGLPTFWARNNFRANEDRAVGFAYSFLGVRIQYAQCHKHPFDQWSKDDFDQFAKLFGPVRANQNNVARDDYQQASE